MVQQKTAKSPFVSAALEMPSGAFLYRFYLSASLFLLMLFLLAFHYSEVGFFIVVLVSALFCADVFVRSAWRDLSRGKIGFPLLVSVAVYAGFFYSACHTFDVHATFGPVEELYLYVSLFLTLSLWVQSRRVRERERAKVYIKKIDDFLPKAGRKFFGTSARKVFSAEIKPGDKLLVKPGERFACDGIIEKGNTSVDEQLITGNRVPAYKQPGHKVYAGTLNKSSEVTVRVEKPLSSSALLHVVESVQNSELRRSTFSSELDTYAAWTFAALVLTAGGQYAFTLYQHGVGAWWHDSGMVWVILSLCTPVALLFAEVFAVAFAKRNARANGIYIQNRYALDQLTQADTVFFDKTGTLTYGYLTVSSVCPAEPQEERALVEAAACAEQQVGGPFATAIMNYARSRQVVPPANDSLEIWPGIGVRVKCGKDTILAGRIQWLEEQGISLPKDVYKTAQTVVCVAKNKTYLGYLILADSLRPGAKEVVDFLQQQGKEIILISGDNEPAVMAVAQETGIAKHNANVLPKTKAEIITNLRALGKRVVMVGDGFNDIIALLNADAGIAYASRKNVYTHWVDIIISRQDLFALKDLFYLRRSLVRVSRANAVLAFLLSVAWVEILFWGTAHVSDWRWTVGGSLVILFLVYLNSMRLLKSNEKQRH